MAKKFLSTLKIVNLPSDPISGSDGELYFNSSASVAKIYQAGAWSVLGAVAGGGSTTVSTTEPASPEIGDSWYKNDTGEFYVYDGTYWVEVNGVIEPDGVTSILGTANEINVSASIGNIVIGIPDSPVFVTPNIGVATATSINGTTIPNSATLVVSTNLSPYLTQSSASTTYLTQTSASTLYSLTSHNHTLNSLSNVSINSLADGQSIVWNSASAAWVNQLISGGGGGATTTVSETAPASAELGDTWYKQSDGSFFIYDGTYWVEVTNTITMTDEQAQDKVSSLFVHSNHSNLTATYDDANNQIIMSTSASVSSEQVQDLIAPLFTHANHTNITATYDDGNNQILLSASGGVNIDTTTISTASATTINTISSSTYRSAEILVQIVQGSKQTILVISFLRKSSISCP